jgi:hypothetical protein
MCDDCESHNQNEAGQPLRKRRLKLFEIDPQWHCTIIGTCLTIGELRGLVAKLRAPLRAEAAPYELHSGMVHLASRDRGISKGITKLLDRKHALALIQFSRATDSIQLAALWSAAMAKGEVASACWAVLSHPGANADLQTQVFQEVHMLSHQVGAAARADLRLIHGLEQEKAELEAKVARQQARLRDEIGRRDQDIRDLTQRLDYETAEARRLAHAALSAGELDRLRPLVAEMQSQLTAETARRAAAEDDARMAQAALQHLDRRTQRLLAENTDLAEENQSFEARMASELGQTDRVGHCATECKSLDLCGRCILFVGGRNHHLPHLRRLVEDSNGVFAHHDGGIEESIGRLHGLFGRADAVLFPVDCISHSAQDEVKQLCRRWQKPFVPVRRSGLGAYILALEVVAAAVDTDTAPSA